MPLKEVEQTDAEEVTIESYLDSILILKLSKFHSNILKKDFIVDVYLPVGYSEEYTRRYKVLYMNDGHDMKAASLKETLYKLQKQHKIEPIICVAVHPTERLQEYGVSSHPDFAKRGSKAKFYTYFVTQELMTAINEQFRTLRGAENTAVMGFSLGGLSAFDMAWSYPEIFSKIGAFSAAFWWRRVDLDKGYKDTDRIMHDVIRKGYKKEGLKFWLQCGTKDEAKDRDGDGIIDSIGDTLHIIDELEAKGYSPEEIKYVEVQNGTHSKETWGLVIPDFLIWAFPKR